MDSTFHGTTPTIHTCTFVLICKHLHEKHQPRDKNKERLLQVSSKFPISVVGFIIMVHRLLMCPLNVPRLRLCFFFFFLRLLQH